MSTIASKENIPQSKWWVALVFGILSVLVGIFFLVQPGITSAVAAKILGIYWVIAGVISLVHMFQDHTAWGWKLFVGLLGIGAGLLILFTDPIAAMLGVGLALVLVLGFWAIFMGIVMLISAFKGAGWGTGIMGALAIFLGIILIWNPMAATLGLPLVIGIFAIIGGIINIYVAFKIK